MQTRGLAASFKGLNSSLSTIGWHVTGLESSMKIVVHARFQSTNISCTESEGVKHQILSKY